MDYNILRANDVRGTYPEQINKEVATRLGKSFGTYVLSKNKTTCVVGYDNRLSADELKTALIEGLLSTGVNVINIGLCTTPLFNFSSRELKEQFGVMVTASHNPANHNGFKVFGNNYSHLEQDELEILYGIFKTQEFKVGTGILDYGSFKKEYIDMLVSKAKITKPLKVIIDTGNGTPSILIKDVFDALPIEVTYLNAVSDGSFPVHNPDPNEPENLVQLRDKILETNADIGLGFDGDGDRVGIVNEFGDMVATDIILGVFAENIIPKVDNKNIITDIKCSSGLEHEIKKVGGNPLMLKNGSAYIENMMYTVPALFGGEYSGHIFFRDDFDGYDDGIYAGIRFLNLLCETGKKCSETYEHFEKFVSTPEIKVAVSDERKWEIVEKVKEFALSKYTNVKTIDGIRVDYDDGFALIRGSNTSAYLTLRFEAKDEETLEIRKREFLNLVNYYIKN